MEGILFLSHFPLPLFSGQSLWVRAVDMEYSDSEELTFCQSFLTMLLMFQVENSWKGSSFDDDIKIL